MNARVDGRELDERDTWGPFLSSAAYAIWSTSHTILKATPGKLVFGRDMILSIHKLCGRLGAIEQQYQKEIARNNKRENTFRINHDYKVGDKLLLKKPGKHLRN
jgi:hypothetical protein